MSQNPLSELPVRKIWAAKTGGGRVPVLVDGDYDGEYIAQYKWRTLRSGYVYRVYYEDGRTYIEGVRQPTKLQYLHHLVLPVKKGYWVTHLNGDKLDNRSVNLAYVPIKEMIRRREEKKRSEHMRKYYARLANPRKEN